MRAVTGLQLPLSLALYRSKVYLFKGPAFSSTLILVTPTPRGRTDFAWLSILYTNHKIFLCNNKYMMNDLTHITHDCIPLFINDDSHYLILGSLPSVKSREEQFYYAHKRNRFFAVLSDIFNENAPFTVDEKKAFLKRHKVALYDVIYECDIHKSSDASIKNAKVIDIKDILVKYPSIKVIAINGGKAKSLFDKYLLHLIPEGIEIVYLPSTSPANAKMSQKGLDEAYSVLSSK